MSFAIALVILLGLPVKAFALDNTIVSSDLSEYKTFSNEYDYLLMLQNCTQEELAELGMKEEDVENLEESFYKAIEERAALSVEELLGFGYTQEEISILKAYSNGARVSGSEIRSLAAVLTASIKLNNCGTKTATFRYEWSWDHAPFMALEDSAAMRWIAYDKNGYELDVTKTVEEVKINYYLGDVRRATFSGTQEPNLEFNSINVQFSENILVGSDNGPTTAYGKDGSIKITVKVEDSVDNEINYIKVAALYGHTLIGANAPSISLSPTGSISISFSGNTKIDKLGGHKVKIGVGSTIEDI